jgi:hypothetical protein
LHLDRFKHHHRHGCPLSTKKPRFALLKESPIRKGRNVIEGMLCAKKKLHVSGNGNEIADKEMGGMSGP